MIYLGNFLKNPYISVIFIAKPKNLIAFAFTYVSECSELLYGSSCMNSYSVDSDDELKASLLKFF